ncbi:MAG: Eco57I restriction-modification methylase domain-containing protein [Phycisphaerales bacterium]|nr:Eco57I restriction-modification methylase domain-containing protein [Phycisphaerales bacterium]
MSTSIADLTALVRGFAEHLARLVSPEYKESQARLQYIDPFWTALGWDVSNAAQRPPQDVDVMVEPSMDTVDDGGFASRKPDYIFRLNGFSRFIVEAKKPSIDLDADRKAAYQTKRYAWSAAIPFAILTNFKQFRLFDTALTPALNEPKRGLIDEFALDFEDYPSQWDVLFSTFRREAVAGGSLEALRAKIRRVRPGKRLRTPDRMVLDLRGDEPVDRVFLDHLEVYRRHFATAIYRENKKAYPDAGTLHGAARLTETIQRLIDRIVFMRVCEDRGISEWGGLRETVERINSEGGDLYATLLAQFRQLDREYNGYLFKIHTLSESVSVPDVTLADFITHLYPPDGAWDFSAIGDEILGIVYERFLGNVVTVQDRQIVIEEKPEVRHAGGVYYTPRFVVDTIIRRVVGPKIAGKSPAELLDVKVLDPACGSGSFLVTAFQYLMDHCLSAIADDPTLASVPASPRARKKRKEIAFKDDRGAWQLAPDFKAAVLTNCIHGVDIDQQAVEVTVMSLYLKMLEGTLPPNWQRDWLERELLPPLDNNIQCGNSLIDSESFDAWLVDKHGGLFPLDEDVRFRINRFDWTSRTRGFGRLLDEDAVTERGRAGFDCIIGNPPYIRVQELNKWAPQECEFYKWKYKSAKKGNYDIYVVFTERGLDLLVADGLLGFIMPHKFWQAQYGEGLRKVLADGKHIRAVIDFGDQQVFRGATTYTAIHVIGRAAATDRIDYAKVVDLVDGDLQCRAIEQRQSRVDTVAFPAARAMPEASWVFVDASTSSFMSDLVKSGPRLAEYAAKVFVGIQTSADKVFILERQGKRYYSEQLETAVDLEPDLLHPLLKGSVHMKRWVPLASPQVVLFPYQRRGEDFGLIPAKAMRDATPATWDYLTRCRNALKTRERGTFEGEEWYGYVYPKNLASMSEPKILTPSLGQRAEYGIDPKGDYFFVGSGGGGGGGYGVLLHDWSQAEYVLGLLNSRLLDWFVQRITTPFHSGWFAYSKAYIAQIPIKIPKTADEKKMAARIVDSVRAIMVAKTKLRAGGPPIAGVKGGLRRSVLSDRETKALEAEIERQERRIDETVFELYGVNGLPEG